MTFSLLYSSSADPHFEYDLDIATLQTRGDSERAQAHITEKAWVTAKISEFLAQACKEICAAVRLRLRADLCDDNSENSDDNATHKRMTNQEYYHHVDRQESSWRVGTRIQLPARRHHPDWNMGSISDEMAQIAIKNVRSLSDRTRCPRGSTLAPWSADVCT